VGVWCFESSTEADWAIAGIVVGSVALVVAAAVAAVAGGAVVIGGAETVLIGGVETEAGTLVTEESTAYFRSLVRVTSDGGQYFEGQDWWVRFSPENPLDVIGEPWVTFAE
jgi:hypothetical protein